MLGLGLSGLSGVACLDTSSPFYNVTISLGISSCKSSVFFTFSIDSLSVKPSGGI